MPPAEERHRTRPPPHAAAMRLWLMVGLAAAIMAVHIWWYFFLCDDAYIAFRYARNLTRGRGLVFNVGEPVEGYTSLLWVLQLAVGYVLGISGEVFPHILSLGYTLGALLVWMAFIHRQPGPHRAAVSGVVLLMLSLHRTWAIWATSGLETRAFTFFVLLMFYGLLRAEQAATGTDRRRWLTAVSLVLALATLTRPDAQAFFPLVVGYWVLTRGGGRRELLGLSVPFLAIVGAEYAWRYAYYGAWLPNTYYAKVGDPWPEMGMRYLAAFVLEYGYYLALPLVAFAWRWWAALSRRVGLLALACMTMQASYYCYRVGGDHFEFRIFDFFVPLLAWMTAESLVAVYPRHRVWAVGIGMVAVVYSIVIPMSAAFNTGRLQGADFAGEVYNPSMQFKVTAQNTAVARWLPGMRQIISLDRGLIETLNTHLVGTRQEVHRACWLFLRDQVELARGVGERGILPPMMVNASHPGVLGYYVDVPIIDMLGLTDAYVARLRKPNEMRFMAHERSAPFEYLDQRHAHIRIVSATTHPLPQQSLAAGPVVPRPRQSYSIRLGDGVWLNIRSWDPDWIRANFRETPDDLIPPGIDANLHGTS